MDSFYSYVTIGADTDTIAQWEIAKHFRPTSDPSPGIVLTADYAAPYAGMKPYCVLECTSFDCITLDGNGAWGSDKPALWSATFVSEPSAYTLMLGELGVFGMLARRRKGSHSASV